MALFGKLFSGTPESRFWDWFAKNSSQLARVSTAREPICNELAGRLRKYEDGLVFLFGPVKDGRREFIVSADGISPRFPAVQRLVGVAPSMPGWHVIAFRPAGDSAMSIQVDDRRLTPDDVWFDARSNGAKVDLLICVRGASTGDDWAVQIGFLFLDHALGEYIVGTRIGGIQFDVLPPDHAAAGLKPFSELPKTVRRMLGI